MARLMIALGCITLLVTLAIAGGQSSRPPAGTAHSGAAFRFNKVADGVYHAIGTGTLTVIGNSAVISVGTCGVISGEERRSAAIRAATPSCPLITLPRTCMLDAR